jgi:HEAT repeat protein
MNVFPLRPFLLSCLLLPPALAQDWTGEQLAEACPGFQDETLTARLEQVGKLLAERQAAFSALVTRLHGDHREYRLRIDKLLEQLVDPRWQVREDAERTLVEIGSQAWTVIQQAKDNYSVLEQHIRCARILDAIAAKGTEQQDRERRLLRGLATTALYLDPDPRLLRSLRSALGHTDPSIAESALRALGKLGGDEEVDAVVQMVQWKGGFHRQNAVSALGRMRSERALAVCRQLLWPPATGGPLEGGTLTRTEAMAILRALRSRDDVAAKALLQELGSHPDPVIANGARLAAPDGPATKGLFTLPDRSQVEATFGGFLGESTLVAGAFRGLPEAELSFGECDTVEFPGHAPAQNERTRVFLNQGSLVTGDLLGVDPESVRLRSPVFGELVLPRREIQGIAIDPALDRLVGASTEYDRVRLRSGEFVDGAVTAGDGGTFTVRTADGRTVEQAAADLAGILFARPRVLEPDPTTYSRIDLVSGERLIGFLAGDSPSHIVASVPLLGAATIPLENVTRIELGVGGGAMWGFTLIADYSDNRIVEVDDQGRIVFVLEEIFGAWDAECLDNGNLLITEFSVSRVQEVDRKGKTVWSFEKDPKNGQDLKNPYDADRLPDGNTLIADTFGSRVIEVDRDKNIVWSYGKEIRPFDCDRLPNGNTLIADVLKDRIIEVSPAGEIAWEVKGLPNAHDADRLPNGNTLVTLRNKGVVVELDREGKVVWELQGLSSPSDADRLPNGHTIVAENTRVREFDRRGNEVWKKEMTWAVEVNRY